MNVEYFIAKRLFTAKEENNTYTKPILRIVILAIALSVAVMLISIMVVTGFKNDISDKIIGFGSHITISNFTNNQSYESEPISVEQDFYPSITAVEGVKHISTFATKAGIIKTADEIQGVVLKGVSSDYDWTFFKDNLVSGSVFEVNDSVKSNQILISENISKTLDLNVGDGLVMYFVQNPPRVRKFHISGIYNTAMSDFDKLFVLGDINHIQALNGWENNEVGGFEIQLTNFDDLDKITDEVYNLTPYNLNAQSIKEKTPQIFNWLDLQDVNVFVILILMLIVGVINMITALLILILERTKTIGILKALGATNWSVRKIFLYSAVNLIVKGLLVGNAIALSFAFLQKQFSLISLDPATYYMDTVPINFDLTYILLLNIGTVVVCYLVLIVPSVIITKITAIKAIRFE
ncbi:MAG: ABC transporter permease [Flavobacteriales bacterium]|nr:ABC transporter permease [Flavobacteriales bacterium]